MDIRINPKSVTKLADSKLMNWYIQKKNNMPVHYRIVLQPDELVSFVKKEYKVWNGIEKFMHVEQDNFGKYLEYMDKDRDNGYVQLHVDADEMLRHVAKFSQPNIKDVRNGGTFYGVIADIYQRLPSKDDGYLTTLLRLHGKYCRVEEKSKMEDAGTYNWHYSFWDFRQQNDLELILRSADYKPDDTVISRALYNNGRTMLSDGNDFVGDRYDMKEKK